MTHPGTRVDRVGRVEVDQGGVAGRGRGAAPNWHQLKQISSKWINILEIGNVTSNLILIFPSLELNLL